MKKMLTYEQNKNRILPKIKLFKTTVGEEICFKISMCVPDGK